MRRRFGYEELGLGIFIGLVIGSALGFLYAPKEGAKTRSEVAEYLEESKGSFSEFWNDFQNKADDVFFKIQGMLGLQKKTIRRRLDELKSELENLKLNQVS